MPTPSGRPPHSKFTVQAAQNRAAQAARKAAREAVPKAVPEAVRVDPDFFKRVMKLIKTHKRPISAGLAMSGLTLIGTAVIVAAVGNASDPRKLFEDRSMWNEMLGDLKLSAWDVWISFFSLVTPYWVGHAAETVQRYLRFELIGMFDELGRIATEMSSTLTSLAWDIVEYDGKLVELLVMAGGAFALLLPFSANPIGKSLLGAAAVAFLTLLVKLILEFVGKVKALDLKLEALGHKMFELRGLFSVGADKLHLQSPGSDPSLWKPAIPS